MLNFEYQYNFKEFAIACFFLTYQSKLLRLVFIIIMLINLASLALQLTVHHHITLEDIINCCIPFVILSLLFIVTPIMQFRRVKEKTLMLQIQEQNLKSKMDTISSEIGWDNILKVVKLGNMLGFFYTKNCAILLSLRLVSNSEKQEILQLCQQKNIPTKF